VRSGGGAQSDCDGQLARTHRLNKSCQGNLAKGLHVIKDEQLIFPKIREECCYIADNRQLYCLRQLPENAAFIRERFCKIRLT